MDSRHRLPMSSITENNVNEECSVCYESFENKAYVNDCLHNFCYNCIVSWTKIKAVCPLCVQPITGIITNVRSWNDYDIHIVDPPTTDPFAAIGDSDFEIPSDDTDTESSYGEMESMISDFEYSLDDNEFTPPYDAPISGEEGENSDAVSVNSLVVDNDDSVDNSYDEEDNKDDTENEEEDSYEESNNSESDYDESNNEDDDEDDNDNDEEFEDDEDDDDSFYDNDFLPTDDYVNNDDDDEDEELETYSNCGETLYIVEDSDEYNDNYASNEPLESDHEFNYPYDNYCDDSNTMESINEFYEDDSIKDYAEDDYVNYYGDSEDLYAYDDGPDYIFSSSYY